MEKENKTFEIRDLRDKERFFVDDKFLNGYARFIGIYTVGVYNSLCRHTNKQQKCWPSIKKIAQELDIGRNSVIEAIKKLEFWRIVVKKRVGKQATNRYFLTKKNYWKPISEVYLKDFSEVYGINFKGLQGKLQEFTGQTSNSKETQKKGNTKERKVAASAVADIPKIINLFQSVSPNTYKDWFNNTTERKAAAELLEKMPFEKLEVLIVQILPQLNVLSYVGKDSKAFKPSELLRNLDKIISKIKELQIKRSGLNKKIEMV